MGKVDEKNIKKLKTYLKKTKVLSVYLKQNSEDSRGLCNSSQTNK